MEINGCTALVTGSNRGIGKAFVEELISAGAQKVYMGMRNLENFGCAFEGSGVSVCPIHLDVTKDECIESALNGCADVTILINNAGVFCNETLMGADDISNARLEMEVNFFGTLKMCRAFAPILAKNGGGHIVNVLSAAAIVSLPNMGGYSPSKFASRALTTCIRAELAAQGTAVTGLIVGSVDTRMASHVAGKKESPNVVARAGLRAIRDEINELDTDQMASSVRAALARDSEGLEKRMAALLHAEMISTGQ